MPLPTVPDKLFIQGLTTCGACDSNEKVLPSNNLVHGAISSERNAHVFSGKKSCRLNREIVKLKSSRSETRETSAKRETLEPEKTRDAREAYTREQRQRVYMGIHNLVSCLYGKF